MKIISFKRRKTKLLAKEQQESYENAKISDICKEKFENKYLEEKMHLKLEIIFIIQGYNIHIYTRSSNFLS